MEDLFRQIRNHRLVPLASIYLVASWVLLQLGDVTIEPLGLPEWSQTVLIFIIAAGFPVALFVGWFVVPVQDPLSATPAAIQGKSRYAVLPLQFAEEGDASVLKTSISENLINRLATLADIEVISRVSSFRFTTETVDIDAIRQKLGVSHLITGSIRPLENSFLIAIDCTDVQTTTNVWSLSEEYPKNDFRAIETDLAETVIAKLSGKPKKSFSKDEWRISPEAYQQFLLARAGYRRSDFPQAILHASRSVELDHNNPLGENLLAEIYLIWGRFGFQAIQDPLLKALQHLKNTKALTENYPPSQMVQAALSLYLERDLTTAVKLSRVLTQHRMEEAGMYSRFLGYASRTDESIALLRNLLKRDPLNLYNLVMLHRMLRWEGEIDEADEVHQFCLEVDRKHAMVGQDATERAIMKGDYDRAERYLYGEKKRTGSWIPPIAHLWIGNKIEMALGNIDKAQALADELSIRDDAKPTIKVTAYLNCHDLDNAFKWWEKGIEQFDAGVYQLPVPFNVRTPREEIWPQFVSDPRFNELKTRMGTDDETLASIDWIDVEEILA